MYWDQIITVIASNIALFIWARTEASNDRREAQRILAEDRKSAQISMETYRSEMLQVLKEIKEESRDFHDRLYSLEVKVSK